MEKQAQAQGEYQAAMEKLDVISQKVLFLIFNFFFFAFCLFFYELIFFMF